MKEPDEEWLTAEQARRKLGVSARALYALIDAGDLPAYRIGSRIRLRAVDIRQYLERRDRPGEP